MKQKKLYIYAAAFFALFAGCSKSLPGDLKELQVSTSFVSIPADGGKSEITVSSEAEWAFVVDKEAAKWLTVSPMSGKAGKTKVSFSAGKTINTNSATLKLVVNKKVQYINVTQLVGSGDPEILTCKKALGAPEGKEVMLKGNCISIANKTYGNWTIKDDTGEIFIYGTKDWKSCGIEVGDEVLISGPRKSYKGNPQLQDIKVLKVTKSLIKLEKSGIELEKEGGDFVVKASFRGSVTVKSDAPWLTLTDPLVGGNTTNYKFHADSYDVTGSPRKAVITLIATIEEKKSDKIVKRKSEVTFNVIQYGNIPAVATIEEAVKGSFVHVQGTVMAITNNGYVLSDNSASILVYIKDYKKKNKIGDKIDLAGSVGVYGYGYQINAPFGKEVKTGFIKEIKYPDPVVLDMAKKNEIVASLGNDINKGTLKVQYVKAEGTVSKTKYTNIFVNGDKSFKISPYGLTDMFKLEDKSKVEIEGYLVSVSKYGIFNVALTKVTKK